MTARHGSLPLLLAIAIGGCGEASNNGGTTDGSAGDGDAADTHDTTGDGDGSSTGAVDDPFSFFVTSLTALQEASGDPDGFGGDFGGLEGADALCQQIAGDAGYPDRTWVAFMSTTAGGPNGGAVHAIDRIGTGPWHDRNGRLIAMDLAGLLQQRPAGEPQAVADLSDEYGIPTSVIGDSHDVLTGSNAEGRLDSTDPLSTCNDWTNADDVENNTVMAGHSWPRGNSGTDATAHWISAHPAPGCAPGSDADSGFCVGCNGGYGALYCFAVTP